MCEVTQNRVVRFCVVCLFLFVSYTTIAAQTGLSIPETDYLDRLEGGWVGQMAGVAWGHPVEFHFERILVPEDSIPIWYPDMIDRGYHQDDLYCEIPFIKAMLDSGILCNWVTFGDYFRDTEFTLWHANWVARFNLQKGIPAPDCGHYLNDTNVDGLGHTEDIDWQIESGFCGLVAPGQPMTTVDLAWRAGHVVGFGDGVLGGVFLAVMQSAAFTAVSVDDIIEAGRQSLPEGSKYRQLVDDVILWKTQGFSWQENWQLLDEKWGHDDRCPKGYEEDFNIDAKLNGACVLIGLLYGNGDIENSMRITMRCGHDTDSNVSPVGGILGSWLGLSHIPEKFKSGLNRSDSTFITTGISYEEVIDACFSLAKKILLYNGGNVEDGIWNIPLQALVPPLAEQWPYHPLQGGDRFNYRYIPYVKAAVSSIAGKTVTFTMASDDPDGIRDHQWFFGDLSYAGGKDAVHTYPFFGDYLVTAYTIDNTGNTAWDTLHVHLPPRPFVRLEVPDSLLAEEGPDPAVLQLMRDDTTGGAIAVRLAYAGTAEPSLDYLAAPEEVEIPAGQFSRQFVIQPVDDDIHEGDEILDIRLCGDPAYILVPDSTARLILLDNDPPPLPPLINMTVQDTIIPENGEEAVTVGLTRSDTTGGDLSVQLLTAGTAVAGKDYEIFPLTVPFPRDSQTVFLEIRTVDDDSMEGDEDLFIMILSGNAYRVGDRGMVRLIIVDDERPPVPPSVRMLAMDTLARESGPKDAYVRIESPDTLDTDLTVWLSVSGTARNGVDYETIPDSIVMPAGKVPVDLFIIPLDDDIYENPESVHVRLIPDSAYTFGGDSSVTIWIEDNDTPPDMIAYWPLDEGTGLLVRDSTGRGHDGDVTGTAWVQGRSGYGLFFAGGEYSHVRVPHQGDLTFDSTHSYSLAAWVKLMSLPDRRTAVIAKGNAGSIPYGIWIDEDNQWVYGGETDLAGEPAVTGWHHIVIVQNGGSHWRKLWVDGKVQTDTGKACSGGGTGDLFFGRSWKNGEGFSGVIDDVRLYGYALQKREIQDIIDETTRVVSDPLSGSVPHRHALHAVFPNPFNAFAVIGFDVAVASTVSIDIYNMIGQQVNRILHSTFYPGTYQYTWNGRDSRMRPVESGIYFVRMRAGSFEQVRKILVVR